MELKPLGNAGVMVPEVGLGVWKYSGGVEPLRRAIELGAFLIDTAEIYGTEDVVGQAIKGMRERVFLATKVSPDHLRMTTSYGRRRRVCVGWRQIRSICTRSIGRTGLSLSRKP
jgi:diketogulonate reductase-like aldo/keto reductase